VEPQITENERDSVESISRIAYYQKRSRESKNL